MAGLSAHDDAFSSNLSGGYPAVSPIGSMGRLNPVSNHGILNVDLGGSYSARFSLFDQEFGKTLPVRYSEARATPLRL
jgi:hypothetical protein